MPFKLILDQEQPFEKEHCCALMAEQANLTYPEAAGALLGSTDKRIYWSPLFDEFGLICQPSAEILLIANCPFCGTRLPPSQRNKWFAKLGSVGWKNWGDPIPREFFFHAWREL